MSRKDMLTDTHADTGRSEFADSIPLAATAGGWSRHGQRPAKRNRQWEKAHRSYRYVNVSLEVREEVLALAEHLHVPADDVAHAFFEYGLDGADEGKLQLKAQPNPLGRKMTLFPQKQIGAWEEAGFCFSRLFQIVSFHRRWIQRNSRCYIMLFKYILPKRWLNVSTTSNNSGFSRPRTSDTISPGTPP